MSRTITSVPRFEPVLCENKPEGMKQSEKPYPPKDPIFGMTTHCAERCAERGIRMKDVVEGRSCEAVVHPQTKTVITVLPKGKVATYRHR